MNTLSDTPIWTSYVIVGREASMTATHILKEISSGDRKVVFDRGLRLAVTIEWDGDLCLASDERFGLYGSGHSQEEAISDYSEFFVEFYSDIVNTPNRELPPSTQSLKRTLKTFGRLEKRV